MENLCFCPYYNSCTEGRQRIQRTLRQQTHQPLHTCWFYQHLAPRYDQQLLPALTSSQKKEGR